MSDSARKQSGDAETRPPATDAGAAADDELLAALADEFAARVRRHERPTVEEFAARQPQLEERIRKVLPAIALMEATRSFDPASAANVERPGSTVGGYKLLEHIGEGGFGVVYLAEQHSPVRRKVALKILKPGMDTRQVIARFDAERQALAVMDHPNIAKVFDGGMTDSGRPYFVMELVKGVPITEFCDQYHLTPRGRLELFAHVCHAVQHAHTKGIIHRDIKPSNVLVTMHDTTPLVKVIDFGVAKALGQELTERTLFTGFAQLLGTPLYMSPEQAGHSALDVDTRSDIYSLGVLLYELLTGTTPFDQERFRRAAHDEIRRIIREEDPPKPSTRLIESKASLASVSAQRQTEPARLTKLIRGELDWIVMKALEKDRARRYETANGFAMDVQRYLTGEPVLAAPASQWYRMRKVARRRRGPVAAAALVLTTLLCGVVGTTWGLFRAEQQRQLAAAKRQEAVEERDAKDGALKAERQAREDEAKAREQAFAALRSMTADVIEKKFTQGAALTEDDRAFLRGVIAQFDAFAAIKADDADWRALRAEGRFRVANIRDTLGELKEAEQDYDEALSILEQLVADSPSQPELRINLAMAYNNRGNLLYATGRSGEAEQDRDRALIAMKQLAADFPSDSGLVHTLAIFHRNRGNLLLDTGRPQLAEQDFEQALSILKQLVDQFASVPTARRDLARTHISRGLLRRDLGRLDEAEEDFDEALGISRQLAADFPAQPDFRVELVWTHNNRGNLLLKAGRIAAAEQDFDQAVNIQTQLAADFPSRPEFRHTLAMTYDNRANLLSEAGRRKEAEQDYQHALSIFKQLLAHSPDQPGLRSGVAGNLVNLAILHTEQQNWAAAKRLLLESRPYHLAALAANPQDASYRQFYRNNLKALASVHAVLLEPEDAVRTAETRRDLGWDAPADAYDAACFLSRCISMVAQHEKLNDQQRQDAVQFYGDAAMNLLREAVSKGYADVPEMKDDPRLNPLRPREDFQKLVSELEALLQARIYVGLSQWDRAPAEYARQPRARLLSDDSSLAPACSSSGKTLRP